MRTDRIQFVGTALMLSGIAIAASDDYSIRTAVLIAIFLIGGWLGIVGRASEPGTAKLITVSTTLPLPSPPLPLCSSMNWHHKRLTKRKQTMESSSERFVVDGYQREWKAIEERVRPQVEGEYAEEWNCAGLIRRWFLLGRIEKEIARRVALEAPPPDTLY